MESETGGVSRERKIHRRVPPEAWDERLRTMTRLSAYVFVRSRIARMAIEKPEPPASTLPKAA